MSFTGNGITNCYPDQVEDFISITVLMFWLVGSCFTDDFTYSRVHCFERSSRGEAFEAHLSVGANVGTNPAVRVTPNAGFTVRSHRRPEMAIVAARTSCYSCSATSSGRNCANSFLLGESRSTARGVSGTSPIRSAAARSSTNGRVWAWAFRRAGLSGSKHGPEGQRQTPPTVTLADGTFFRSALVYAVHPP